MKNNKQTSVLGIAVSVLCGYLTAICVLPSSGVLSALPSAVVFSVAVWFFCKKRPYIYVSMAVMPFLVSLLQNFSVAKAVVVGVFCGVISAVTLLAIRGVRSCVASKKAGKSDAFGKSVAVTAVSVVAVAVLQLALFGNPISLLNADKTNKNAVTLAYGDAVSTGSTYYEIADGKYLTEIKFDGAEPTERAYFAEGSRDDFKASLIDDIVFGSKQYFSAYSTLDVSEIKCRIDGDSFVYTGDVNPADYYSQAEYLIERNEKVTGVTNFGKLYREIMKYALESEDLQYSKITVTATDNDGNVYYAEKSANSGAVFSKDNGERLNELQRAFE